MAHNMTDIHMHLIPGVDDGAMDRDMALTMLLQAREEGVTAIFATPHNRAFRYDREKTLNAFRKLRNMAEKFFPDMPLYLGCELRCDPDYMGALLQGLETGMYPTLNDTPYVLTEFSQWTEPEDALYCARALTKAGWIPVIAHMERYQKLKHRMDVADKLKAMGCRIQINAYSLHDEMDETTRSWAQALALEQKADFLGTDAHRTYHRPPVAQSGLNWLYEHCEKDYADALAFANARRLLTGKE